jgi:aminomethyltransferase
MTDDLLTTPLAARHEALGAKMVPFAGYAMPVQYPAGILKEHLHCRAAAGLFDVSHMGQAMVTHPQGWDGAALAFEALVPQDVLGLADGRQRYGLFTNDAGGIEDDLMFARLGETLFVVVNAACKAADFARMAAGMPGTRIAVLEDRALLALQGPGAAAVLAAHAPEVAGMRFMDVRPVRLAGADCVVSRSGYTGEDGYEISVPAGAAAALWEALLADGRVLPIGLGARDSLRLEAGLCLYGHDIDSGTTPAEAGLGWAFQKARKPGGARAGGFPGEARILAELAAAPAPARRRVGLLPEGRAPVREGADLFDAAEGGSPVGAVTSGGFGPSLNAPVAMGYVPLALSGEGTQLWAEVRGRRLPLRVAAMPFVTPGYKR